MGQHLHDASRELVARGHRVVVLTPRGGYDDPRMKFVRKETLDGVEVRRLPMCAFGKKPILLRLLGGLSLVLQSMVLGLFVRGLTYIFISTSPPMSSLTAQFIGIFRRVKIVYWVMDLNLEQMIITEKLHERSWIVQLGEWIHRMILRRADSVVALDSFMAERLNRKAQFDGRLAIISPWPYDHQLVDIGHQENRFRGAHKLNGKFVVMYSGNITDVHPLDTLLAAVVQLKNDHGFLFLFIGAAAARRKIEIFAEDNEVRNIMTLPYVPLDETSYSLSAADLHIITMGENMVGIVHPCKVYGIMSVGRPFLVIGPHQSHLGEIMNMARLGWMVEQGDVGGVVRVLEEARAMPREEWKTLGDRGRTMVKEKYSQKLLCGRLCELFNPEPSEKAPSP